MACRSIQLGDGTFAISCGPRGRAAPCSVPGCYEPHTALCDHPVTRKGKAGTCDAKLCARHKMAVGEDRDLWSAAREAGCGWR